MICSVHCHHLFADEYDLKLYIFYDFGASRSDLQVTVDRSEDWLDCSSCRLQYKNAPHFVSTTRNGK